MRDSLLARTRRAHLIGIGGAGMSGIATALRAAGHRITGSDLTSGPVVSSLRGEGIPVAVGHDASNLPDDADLVVVSAAIRASNPEVVEANRRQIRVVKYAEALGALMAGHRGIAVAGAHGKTTTTGLLAFVLDRLGADPTFLVGGCVSALGGSSRVGRGPYLVAEACEYDRSFLHLSPEIAVVTNIDEDHLDYYSGIAEITEAFRDFARLVPEHGLLVTLNEHEAAFAKSHGIRCRVETVGIGGWADWVATDLEAGTDACRFTLRHRGEEVGRMAIPLPGVHNVLNSLTVLAVVSHLGFDLEKAGRALLEFRGVSRRLEVRFRRAGILVFDDYAHHPAEIRATISAIRSSCPGARIWCVFQPHQASRTRFLLREFASALAGADRVVVPDIFFARDSEEERRRISSLDLVKKILNLGRNARYLPDFDEIVKLLLSRLRPRDVLVTMGAGDVFRVADEVSARLETYGKTSISA